MLAILPVLSRRTLKTPETPGTGGEGPGHYLPGSGGFRLG